MSFEFLYNRSFDNFQLSNLFYDEYNKQYGPLELDNWEMRFDSNVLNIIKKIGLKNAQGPYSRLAITEYPIVFKKYINLYEYDGCEKPYIQWEKYLKEEFLDIDLNCTNMDYIKNIQTNLNIILENN